MSTTLPSAPTQPVPPKRCGSCGADVFHEPKEGEGLPCGH